MHNRRKWFTITVASLVLWSAAAAAVASSEEIAKATKPTEGKDTLDMKEEVTEETLVNELEGTTKQDRDLAAMVLRVEENTAKVIIRPRDYRVLVLLRVTSTEQPADAKDKAPTAGTLKLDLKGLDIDVRQVWAEFTGAVSLDGQPVENLENAGQKRARNISFNAYAGELYCSLKKGESRIFSLDRY